ncbi:Sensor histidine kinase YpdA [Kordia antarctica]|uniref:Sensor histidine kinase YpdA n=1 Tax=Kordia antarctica TaxID=1218801 RepID=A0A7L4ZEC2_9FLAO|nr:histidine kinase [Kordia antarctica]QHI34889.1 Sensor histidine kinase YpdA [Kordia antarctica]
MKPKKLHITIFCILLWSFSFAQQYTNYTTKDGLPSNHVYTILQDAQGFMWFLTDKGMVKYNGSNFTTFTTKDGLSNNDVWEAFTTPDGKIWYFSKASSLGYIKNDSVVSFPNSTRGEIINPTYSFQLGNDIYPMGTNKLYHLKNGTWKIFYTLKNITDDEDAYIHDYTKIFHENINYLKVHYKNEKFSIHDHDQKKLKEIYAKEILHKHTVRGQITDSLFFWTSNKMYSILNLNTLKFSSYNFKDEVGIEVVNYSRINLVGDQLQITGTGFVGFLDADLHIKNPFYFPSTLHAHFGFVDNLNTVWLSTFNKGIYKLPYLQQQIKYLFNEDKIQGFNVLNGELYANIFNKGIYKFDPLRKEFNEFIKVEEYIFSANEIEELGKNYFTTKTKIFIEHHNQLTTVDFNEGQKQSGILNSLARKFIFFEDYLYGNFSFGINKINTNDVSIEKEYIQKGTTDILTFKNRLLIATTNGLRELKNDSIHSIYFKNNTLDTSILNLTKITDQLLLINTDGFGSYLTNLETIQPLKGSEFLIVQDAFIEDKSLWLATNTGVLHFIKKDESYKLNRTYNQNDGLPNNNINSVYVNETDLIVATNSGLAILPKNQKKQSLLLDVFIKKASYNSETITTENNSFAYVNNNTLSVEVSRIDFSEDQHTSYTYKLEPIQKTWSTSVTNVFNFNDLQPNTYTLKIASNTIEKQISFTIKPLWWQTLWAKIGGIFLLLIGIVFTVWRISKKSQEKKNEKLLQEKQLSEIQLKALRSQMNPHFVFNSLAAIQYYINNNEIKASETYLVKFSKLIRQFFELSKETEINLEQEIKLIKNYLDIEKLRFKEKFEYQIHIDDLLNTKTNKIPTMLLQPIVENAVNHGIFNKMDNGKIDIYFKFIDEKNFQIEIVDDGVGVVNTQNKATKKVKSSNVLDDRLKYLNQSENWKIIYKTEELHPELTDKGNKSTFIITQL